MNSIDDFAALRPLTDDLTPNDLDRLWQLALSDRDTAPDERIDRTATLLNPIPIPIPIPIESVEIGRSSAPERARRLAVLGAAASLLIGIAAVTILGAAEGAPAPANGGPSVEQPRAESLPSTVSVTTAVPDDQAAAPTTVSGRTIPASARELEGAALTIELGLSGWELVAAEDGGEAGNEYHYQPVGRGNSDGFIDVLLVPGGEAEYRQRVNAATDVVVADALDSTTQFATIGSDSYRYTAVLRGFDLDWLIEIEAGSLASREDFEFVVSAVTVRHTDGRAVNAISETASGARVTIPPASDGARMLAVGDSVMLGAASQLADAGVLVDARASRAFVDGLELVTALVDQQRIGVPTSTIDTVIIHLGANGPIGEQDLRRMIEVLSSVPEVIVVTNGIDRDWVTANNDLIRALPSSHPNVTVLDWERLRTTCPGDCFHADDIHLTPAGQRYYTDLVVGQP